MPFTQGQSVVDASSLDYIVRDEVKPVYEAPAPDFDHLPPAERRIGELIATHFIRDGVTLQVGIGQIPDAVIGTFILMNGLGFTQNMMTLLALSLVIGLLIDDSIVVQENTMRHVEAGKPAPAPPAAHTSAHISGD
jgi:hypothetical protein